MNLNRTPKNLWWESECVVSMRTLVWPLPLWGAAHLSHKCRRHRRGHIHSNPLVFYDYMTATPPPQWLCSHHNCTWPYKHMALTTTLKTTCQECFVFSDLEPTGFKWMNWLEIINWTKNKYTRRRLSCAHQRSGISSRGREEKEPTRSLSSWWSW